MQKKTYLVTGIAGFIGSTLARCLLDQGHVVVGIDNLSTGFVNEIPEKAIFIKGECQQQHIIDKLYSYRFDTIFHIAGQSSGEISFDDPVYDLQTNTQSTLLLLKLCKDTGCKKFIYASSMSVYGNVEEHAIPESYPEMPNSFYGIGKLASEHYLRLYSKFEIGTTALRLFNVYGPGQNLKNMKQGMVSIFLAQALNDKAIHVKGSGKRYRDFIYIDDVIQAFMKSDEYTKPGKFGLYNICSGQKTSVEDLVSLIQSKLKQPIPAKYEGSTPGDQFGIYGDPSLSKDKLNFVAKTKLSIGIDKFIKASI